MRKRKAPPRGARLARLLGLLGLVGLPGLPAPAAGAAQAQAEGGFPETAGAEDILVVAQRREARLLDVPVAVSAFTDRTRDLLGLNSIQELARFAPSVSYQDYPNRIAIRGVGRQTNALGSDPGVAVYQDGVYTSETAPLGQFPLFVERIEVLRGPQGTLYGRNSIAGAVNVISRRPAREAEAEARLVIGTDDLVQPSATVSAPLSGRLRMRLGGVLDYQGRGGVRNEFAPAGKRGLGARDDYYVEAQIEADVGATGLVWLKWNHARWRRSGLPVVQQSPYLVSDYFPANSLLPSATFGLARENPGARTLRRVWLDDPGEVRLDDNHAVTASASVALGRATLRYTGGFQTYDYESLSDTDRTARPDYAFGPFRIGARQTERIGEKKTQHSHELTLTSPDSGPFRWLLGAFAYFEETEQPVELASPLQPQLAQPLRPPQFLPAAPNPGRLFYRQEGRLTLESFAGFGEATLALAPALEATAGLRVTHDRKTGTESFRLLFFEPLTLGPLAGCCALDVTPPVSSRTLRDSWTGVTARADLAWRPAPETLAYLVVANGWKSGGFNLGQVAPVPQVDPETVIALEGGLKLRRGTLSASLAGFWYDYRDLQVLVNVIRNAVLQQDFVNAERARSVGVELEAGWQPLPALDLTLAWSFLDAEFRRFCCIVDVASDRPTLPQDLAGNPLPQAPRHKLALNASLRLPTVFGPLTLGGSFAHVGRQYFAPFPTARYEAAAYEVVDLRAVFSDSSGRLTLIGFVKNLLDEESVNGVSLGPASAGYPRLVIPNAPRAGGLEIQLRF